MVRGAAKTLPGQISDGARRTWCRNILGLWRARGSDVFLALSPLLYSHVFDDNKDFSDGVEKEPS